MNAKRYMHIIEASHFIVNHIMFLFVVILKQQDWSCLIKLNVSLSYKISPFSCSGILPQAEPAMVEVSPSPPWLVETPAAIEHRPATINDTKEEKTTIGKL